MNWLAKLFHDTRAALSGGDSGVNTFVDNLNAYYDTEGRAADPMATAAVEFVLGEVGRSFMSAVAEPSMPALTPLTLAMLARQTMATGNSVMQVGITGRGRGRRLALTPVWSYTIAGGADEDSWRYTYKVNRPNGEDPVDPDQLPSLNRPSEGMVHVRYMPNSDEPWRGIAPMLRSGLTSDQLARIELSLRYDASPPTGYLMPMPDGAQATQHTAVETAVTMGKGALTTIPTQSQGFGEGAAAAPSRDWEQRRFGAQIPGGNVALRDSTFLAVIAACGVPPAMYTSQGAALREAYRHFMVATVVPLSRLIAAELSAKLERDITLRFPELFRSDISARSRAFNSLVQSGVDPMSAAEIVGMPAPIIASETPQEPRTADIRGSNGVYHHNGVKNA